jgi:hypothetical protein
MWRVQDRSGKIPRYDISQLAPFHKATASMYSHPAIAADTASKNPIATARSTNAALKPDGAALFMAVAACSCDVESDMRALRKRRGGSGVDST